MFRLLITAQDCPACGRLVSAEDECCPNCGRDRLDQSHLPLYAAVAVFFAIGVAAFGDPHSLLETIGRMLGTGNG
ncbi:MAG: hypothetical protein ACREE7_04535 [Dongiaceae bacterium]